MQTRSTTSGGVTHSAKACRRTLARRCASASAPRPRGTPTRRRRSTSSQRCAPPVRAPPDRPKRLPADGGRSRCRATDCSRHRHRPGHGDHDASRAPGHVT
ncbi:hypothetical protein M885DRAFT_479095, partial [Pelagophyceae sp. CCMP2097]